MRAVLSAVICVACQILVGALESFLFHAAGNFPIGLSSSGTPTSLQVIGPPGYDSTILSLLLAMDELFGNFPGPPNPSLCAGCMSNVTVREVRYLATLMPRKSYFL